jgi:hypothetical protein
LDKYGEEWKDISDESFVLVDLTEGDMDVHAQDADLWTAEYDGRKAWFVGSCEPETIPMKEVLADHFPDVIREEFYRMESVNELDVSTAFHLEYRAEIIKPLDLRPRPGLV